MWVGNFIFEGDPSTWSSPELLRGMRELADERHPRSPVDMSASRDAQEGLRFRSFGRAGSLYRPEGLNASFSVYVQ